MADYLTTAKVCKNAGLTYDGICIGLPDEYYRKHGSHNKAYLENEILRLMDMLKPAEEVDRDETIREYLKKLELN